MNEFLPILQQIFEIAIIPILAILTRYLVSYIKVKKNELEKSISDGTLVNYIDMLSDTITDCVIATNQTYVESLKNKNAFDAKAQEEAFLMTFNAVRGILSEDAVSYLTTAVGDLDLYITKVIEAKVNENK